MIEMVEINDTKVKGKHDAAPQFAWADLDTLKANKEALEIVMEWVDGWILRLSGSRARKDKIIRIWLRKMRKFIDEDIDHAEEAILAEKDRLREGEADGNQM